MNHEIQEIKIQYSPSLLSKGKVCNSEQAYSMFLNSWDQNNIEVVEEFKIMLLNKPNQVLGIYHVSKGGIDGTVVDTRLIFSVALKALSTQIILCHNHPSGNLKPSAADKIITTKLRSAGDVLDIKVLDHLIITKNGYFSFSDAGM